MINYIILSNLSIIGFYILYKALLQQDSFFKWRRTYLLLAIVFSMIFALVNSTNIHLNKDISAAIKNTTKVNYVAEITTAMEHVIIRPENNSTNWWFVIYSIVLTTLVSILMIRLQILYHLKKKAQLQHIGNDRVWVSTKDIAPFSFFKMIMLGKKDINSPHLEMILQHEKTHVKQWHSIDVLLSELLCIVYFFNPVVYLLKKEIRINLEYLADQNCYRTTKKPKEYQYAILQTAINQTHINISNYFNYSPIKQRIMMLNKQKSNKKAMLKYISILPMVMALFLLSQCTKNQNTKNTLKAEETIKKEVKLKAKNIKEIDEQPIFPGGYKALMNFLGKNIRYPQKAKDNGLEGRLYVQFVIDTEGKTRNIEILRASGTTTTLAKSDTITWWYNKGEINAKMNGGDISEISEASIKVEISSKLLIEEAIRVIESMPKWTPGKINKEAVNVIYVIPIVFKIS